MAENKAYKINFGTTYPLYVGKAERKGRTADEVLEIICWQTGYTKEEIFDKIESSSDMQNFFENAPLPNPNRTLIKGSICGVKIEEITDPIMKEIRYLDKMVDELAKGKSLDKILRK